MPATIAATDIQSLIIDEVGDTADGYLAARIATVWASYADKAGTAPRLQELYSKKRLANLLIGRLREQVDFAIQGDLSRKQSQKVTTLQAMVAQTQVEIDKVERQSIAQRPILTAPITITSPEGPPVPGVISPYDEVIDASDPRYSGDPYRRPPGEGNYSTGNATTGPIEP